MRTIAPERERGIALLIVLWALVLLSLLATAFGTNARTEVYLARNLVESAQAEALADAGIHRAIAGLAKEPREGGFRGDGRMYSWHSSGGEVRFSIRDEGGKIDLNQAPEALLRELFIVLGVDAKRSIALADAIVDFRDEDSTKRPSGAEARDYEAARVPYGPKNGPFEVVDELTYVLGMTSDLYRKAAPFLTTRGEQEPHAYTATPEVRAAMAAAKAGSRAGRSSRNPGISGEERNGPVLSPTSRAPTRMLGTDADDSMTGDGEGGAASHDRSGVPVFTIHAEGQTAGGTVFARDAVVDLSGDEDKPFAVQAWRQADRTLFPPEGPAGE